MIGASDDVIGHGGTCGSGPPAAAGFSLVELTFVVLLIGIIAAMTLLATPSTVRSVKADSAMQQIMAQMRTAKETAVTQRRDVEVRFVGTNQIQLLRQEIGGATTLLSTTIVEAGLEYRLLPGVPDTPDGFGNASAIAFGAATRLMFRSEGMFTDQNPNLDPLDGTIFIGLPNQPLTARAVTIFGPTALVRGYKWNGRQWLE